MNDSFSPVRAQGLAGHSASKAFNDLKNKSDVLAACRSGAPCIARLRTAHSLHAVRGSTAAAS